MNSRRLKKLLLVIRSLDSLIIDAETPDYIVYLAKGKKIDVLFFLLTNARNEPTDDIDPHVHAWRKLSAWKRKTRLQKTDKNQH